ncbi:Glutathione import ATP-binding protein GsiA [Rothia kristinae]|nr:Glutathione import ATP-binding protein GsiA [Rothia kristinae]
MGVVADLADRVAVMRRGRIVETGEIHEVFGNPQHEYTKALLAAVLHLGEGEGEGSTSTQPWTTRRRAPARPPWSCSRWPRPARARPSWS